MTGPICLAWNDLPIEPRPLVAAPGVPKSERNDSFDGLFRASVHWCTRPRLGPRHEWRNGTGVRDAHPRKVTVLRHRVMLAPFLVANPSTRRVGRNPGPAVLIAQGTHVPAT